MYNLNLKPEPKALINFKIGEKFIVSRTGDMCTVLTKYDITNIKIYNETRKKRDTFTGRSWVIPILNT